jgi:hypothetical protein
MPSLTAEEHEAILVTMTAAGENMDRKTIIDALSSNHYDHITSTYFLLAQRQVCLCF